MSNQLLFIIILGSVLLLDLAIPHLSRADLYFGIRIPKEKRKEEPLRKIYKKYALRVLLIGLIIIGLVGFYQQETLFVGAIFALIISHFMIYAKAHKEVKVLKENNQWFQDKKEALVIDTKKRANENMPSIYWFGGSILIIAFNFWMFLSNYEQLPDKIPYHWNGQGVADAFMDKSPLTILFLPGLQIVLGLIMIFVYVSIKYAKTQLDPDDPEASMKRLQTFRKRWGIFQVLMMYALQGFFTLLAANFVYDLSFDSRLTTWLTIGLITLVLGGVVLIALTTGQGGSRVKQHEDGNKVKINRDDDQYWKMGLFYVNPHDPSIFIEKRYGIGFTINFGNKKAIILFFILLSAILTFAFLPSL